MRGIESSVLYPACISFGQVAMKACSPYLRSVSSRSGMSSSPREVGLASLSSLSQARSGYTAWAHPLCFLFSFCPSLSAFFVKSGSSLS